MNPCELPHVSVVVPTHARPELLAACVAALGRLRYPDGRLEIVVVDDGSPTPVDRDSFDDDGRPIRVVRQGRSGPGAARNTGAGLADGELLAFVDDDCAPEPRWLESLALELLGGPPAVAGGRTVNALPDNRFSDASQALVTYLYEYYATRRPERRYFTSNNLAVRRTHFLELGGFDTSFARAAGEDREFCVRCTRQGFALVYQPEAVVRHAHALALGSFWRQHLAYGRAARMCHTLTNGTGETGFEPVAFYARLLAYPHGADLPRPFSASVLLAVAQVANAVGYGLEARRGAYG